MYMEKILCMFLSGSWGTLVMESAIYIQYLRAKINVQFILFFKALLHQLHQELINLNGS